MRLLLIEDDSRITQVLVRGLGEEGFAVDAVSNGSTGLLRLKEEGFDACILDVRLPGLDGFGVLREARRANLTTPILMLTARDSIPDRVRGLDLGADDYLTKPFAFAELLARLRALLRRGSPQLDGKLRCRDLELNPVAHRAILGDDPVDLSPKQFALLELLIRHRGQVVTRAMILERVWGYTFDPGTNLVDVHIANLRQKLDGAGELSRIETVRGVGYRMAEDEA